MKILKRSVGSTMRRWGRRSLTFA